MDVTFAKVGDKRYTITVVREHGPALVPRYGPGYDDLMPHDLAHYVVEEHVGIELGVWGQLAAGGGGIFTPAPEDDSLAYQRRCRRIGAVGRADMARSEQLVLVTIVTWEQEIGRVRNQVRPFPSGTDPASVRAGVDRMDVVARRWGSLPRGGSLTLSWPGRLTFDPATSRRGRRATRRTPTMSLR